MNKNIADIIEKNRLQFETYCDMLLEWNEKFNLTAITDREEIFVKHFADSLLGEEFIPKGSFLLDIGTGAGFPSIPIKIARADITATLSDSLLKRVTFLSEVIERLGLSDAQAVHKRAEELDGRGRYDCVVARAVAPLGTLSEYCLPYVKTGGKFIAYKAGNCEEEVAEAKNAIKILGGGEPVIEKRMLDDNTERAFVIVTKIKPTPEKYPRGKNLPRKSPL